MEENIQRDRKFALKFFNASPVQVELETQPCRV